MSSATLWRRAPVFDAVRVTRPRVALGRNADGIYNIQDLIERVAAAPPGPPPQFSINNIEIDDGALTLDDKPHAPASTRSPASASASRSCRAFPTRREIRVTPRLAAIVNGSAVRARRQRVVAVRRRQGSDARPQSRCAAARALRRVLAAADRGEGQGRRADDRLKVAFVTEKDVAEDAESRAAPRASTASR